MSPAFRPRSRERRPFEVFKKLTGQPGRRAHQRAGALIAGAAGLVALIGAATQPGGAQSTETRSTAGLRSEERPNIVLLFSDDHAAHALSAYRPHLAYGAPLPPTPQLDRLTAEGMLFVDSFVTNSICVPSRAAVLTGQYGHLTGVMTNQDPLHPTVITFPSLLREVGYRTALFGKWHLRADPVGFDHYEILSGQGPYYNPVLHTAGDSARHVGYTPDIITERSLAWLEARDDETPFLLLIHHNASHRYWDPGPEQLALYRDTAIAEPPTFWDNGSGRVFPTRDAEMTIALDLFDRDLKLEAPSGLGDEQLAAWERFYGPENEALRANGPSGDALTRWRYQRYITDYMRTVGSRVGHQRGPRPGLPGAKRSG